MRCRFHRVGRLLGFLVVCLVGVGVLRRRRMCGGVVGAGTAAAHSLLLGRSGGLFGDSGGERLCGSSIAC